MELLLVRHGATEWNATGRFVGRTDLALSELGRRQASALGRMLKHQPIARIISSDLARARATAEGIAASHALPVKLDVRLREFDFGAWEGLTWSEIAAAYPEVADTHAHAARLYAPQGGETFIDVRERVAALINSLTPQNFPGVTVLVAHAGVIHAALSATLGAEFDAMAVTIKTGSVTRLTMKNGHWHLMSLSDVPTDDTTR